MKTILQEACITLEVERSKFLGYSKKITTQEKLKAAIQHMRDMHPAANHVVHGATMGNDGALWSCSDDGEPQGSSGRPVLDIIKGNNLTHTAVIVVRYFGGKKLGIGGLVRAYGEATRKVLAESGVHSLAWRASYTITLPYDLHPKVVRYLQQVGVDSINESFTETVTITGIIQKPQVAEVSQEITTITRGAYELQVGTFQLT